MSSTKKQFHLSDGEVYKNVNGAFEVFNECANTCDGKWEATMEKAVENAHTFGGAVSVVSGNPRSMSNPKKILSKVATTVITNNG